MVKLLFSGDFAPLLEPEDLGSDHFFDLQEYMKNVDLHITNLETPLTNSQASIEKSGPALKSPPGAIELLKQAHVGLACLANNHIYDFGSQGILDTVDICKKNQITTLGIINRPDGQDPYVIKRIQNIRVGFVNFCEHEFSVNGPEKLGAYGYDDIESFYLLTKLRVEVDYLIVLYHGGNEYYHLPSPAMKKTFQFLADLGADAVIAHHSHVYSGFEIYKGKPLIYGLGNFFFPYEGEPDHWHSAVLCELELTEQLGFRLLPVSQCKNEKRTQFQDEETKKAVLKDIDRLSLIISREDMLKKQWEEYIQRTGPELVKRFLYSNKIERALSRFTASKTVMEVAMNSRRRALALNNIIRCQSLRNVVLYGFKQLQDDK